MPADALATLGAKASAGLNMSVNKIIIGSDNGLSTVGSKPLTELIMTYCKLDPKE